MNNILNKKQTLVIIKDGQNIKSTVEYNQNYFTMNVAGEIVPNSNKKTIIEQVGELIVNLEIKLNERFDKLEKYVDERFDKMETSTNERFDNIDKQIYIINQKLDDHENRLKKIEQLI